MEHLQLPSEQHTVASCSWRARTRPLAGSWLRAQTPVCRKKSWTVGQAFPPWNRHTLNHLRNGRHIATRKPLVLPVERERDRKKRGKWASNRPGWKKAFDWTLIECKTKHPAGCKKATTMLDRNHDNAEIATQYGARRWAFSTSLGTEWLLLFLVNFTLVLSSAWLASSVGCSSKVVVLQSPLPSTMDYSTGGSSSGMSSADLQNSLDLMRKQAAVQTAQEMVKVMTEKCFQKCISTPGSSLSSSEQRCVTQCTERFFDSWNTISRSFMQSRQQLLNSASGGFA